jgi:MYXO-CTERM domain-containing protein
MLGSIGGGLTKWDAAQMAIEEMAMSYADTVNFGLQIFPYPNRCEPGAVTIDIGDNDASTLIEGLGEAPPGGGNWTPMAQTLDVAAEVPALRDTGRDNHLILITDGWQWCDPYEASTRFTPVDSVATLRALGVTVHVVGFGMGVDALTLNRAAVAAGTDLPGCDATGSDPSDPNQCYHQANDITELRSILDAIGRDITDELCDGFDNDCDGMIDEDYDLDDDGYTTCGTDDTMPGMTFPELSDCEDLLAEINPGREEICDGIDNDCDGIRDPGCACTDGMRQPCGMDIGVCAPGEQVCAAGTWGECSGGTLPAGESCDGRDEDCDERVDEGVLCPDGLTCADGGCIDLTTPTDTPMDPPPELRENPAMPSGAGCACSTIGVSSTPDSLWGLAGLMGLALVWRRRR